MIFFSLLLLVESFILSRAAMDSSSILRPRSALPASRPRGLGVTVVRELSAGFGASLSYFLVIVVVCVSVLQFKGVWGLLKQRTTQ